MRADRQDGQRLFVARYARMHGSAWNTSKHTGRTTLGKKKGVKTHTFTKLGVQCDGKFEDVAYLRARPL